MVIKSVLKICYIALNFFRNFSKLERLYLHLQKSVVVDSEYPPFDLWPLYRLSRDYLFIYLLKLYKLEIKAYISNFHCFATFYFVIPFEFLVLAWSLFVTLLLLSCVEEYIVFKGTSLINSLKP